MLNSLTMANLFLFIYLITFCFYFIFTYYLEKGISNLLISYPSRNLFLKYYGNYVM